MKINSAESSILDVLIGSTIADSMQSGTHPEFPGLTIGTGTGITGTGYSVTVGAGGEVIQGHRHAVHRRSHRRTHARKLSPPVERPHRQQH